MMQHDDYFRGGESEQYSFFRMPKVFFTDPAYASMSTDAKILYGILLDRMELSRKNGWLDEDGKVYIIYTVSDMMETLNLSESRIYELLQELDTSEKGLGLIERVRRGLGRPNIIYVKKFYTNATVRGPDKKLKIHGSGKSTGKAIKTSTDVDIKTSTNVDIKTSGNVEVKTSRKTRSRPPDNGYQDLQNLEPNNTDKNNTEKNHTDRERGSPSKEPVMYGPFHNVRLSDEELIQLKGYYPLDWQTLITRLSEYIASTGKTYQNHFATLCLWAGREKGHAPGRSYDCPEGEESL